MSDRDPRKMALQICGLRANETSLPADERVFEDPYAERFFPDDVRQMFQDTATVKAERARYEQMMPGVNGAIVARIRFIDEYVTECMAGGMLQLVIIGAGYDTRAYRLDAVKTRARVFEVDHPVTQTVKTETIATIFGSLPDHVVYVPVVFGTDRMDQKLLENGYNPALKTLFIAEGLFMYVAPPAVDGLLAFIANAAAPGSAVVADYFSTAVVEGTSPYPEANVLRQFVAAEGAALQFGVDPDDTEAFFTDRGFCQVTNISPAACKEKYFRGASRDRTVSPMFHFIHASVAPKRAAS